MDSSSLPDPALLQIDITTEDPRWLASSFNPEDHILKVLKLAHQKTCPWLQAEISLLLTHDRHIQELNRTYRHKDKPTNVLSFGSLAAPLRPDTVLGPLPFLLGDVVLSFDTLEKEALEQNKKLEDHFTHLLVHGFLHLLGHDHEEETAAEIMEKKELEILSQLGIRNPYIIEHT